MSEFKYGAITCPYCHGEPFSHKDVHFRMETYFEDEADLNDEQKTIREVRRMPDSPAKTELLAQIERNEPFLCREDADYVKFWKRFGGTTEEAYGRDKRYPIKPYIRPIINPSDPASWKVLESQRGTGERREDYFLYDGDNMVEGIRDIHGKKTTRRVCPHCHNPLPTHYGKYDTKFISVIGVTSSGKTVYISQLLKHISTYASWVKMTAYFTSDHEPAFIADNPVEYNVPLPRATMSSRMTQPMYYDLVQNLGDGVLKTDTIVLYDIAGENCQDAESMKDFGEFVTRSHGIILLIDPGQIGLGNMDAPASAKKLSVTTVLNTIHGAFTARSTTGQIKTPVALCISKADMIKDILPETTKDIEPAKDPETGRAMKQFNAASYNGLQKRLADMMDDGRCQEIHNTLTNEYEEFNYFAFSATGCAVEVRDGLSYPVAPPNPLRIGEPLLWLLYKFGYIGSNKPVRLPNQRKVPKTITEKKPGFFGLFPRSVERPLTPEEKELYWYEERK